MCACLYSTSPPAFKGKLVKKDLLGLFVAVGGRVSFVSGATRQMLQVKLPQRGQSYPEGATPETRVLLSLFLLFVVLWNQVLYNM